LEKKLAQLAVLFSFAKLRQPTGQTLVLLENAKKNLVFHFGVGCHASFPQKPVVKFSLM
jgi:hypothetical protein